mmetsp:Transcript_95318/g.269747  ORF Transcript_95318/g.269747 Transcript_95318/m.269747 type:complete len:200 (-) Transcript_95318:828-1427(-)
MSSPSWRPIRTSSPQSFPFSLSSLPRNSLPMMNWCHLMQCSIISRGIRRPSNLGSTSSRSAMETRTHNPHPMSSWTTRWVGNGFTLPMSSSSTGVLAKAYAALVETSLAIVLVSAIWEPYWARRRSRSVSTALHPSAPVTWKYASLIFCSSSSNVWRQIPAVSSMSLYSQTPGCGLSPFRGSGLRSRASTPLKCRKWDQ